MDNEAANVTFPTTVIMEAGPSTSYQNNKWENCADNNPLKQTQSDTNDPYIVYNNGSFKCILCNMALQPKVLKMHLEGRRHREGLHLENMGKERTRHKDKKPKVGKMGRKKKLRKEVQRTGCFVLHSKQNLKNSILVKDLPRFLPHNTILKYASRYGKVIQSFFRDDNQYAVLQFDELLSAQKVLENKLEFNAIKMKMLSTNYSDTGPRSLNFNSINKDLEMLPLDFQAQFNHLVEKVQPKWLVDNYRLLCSDLENILQEIFPGCTVFPFGAVGTGLGFTTSVVDVHVRFPKRGSTSITTRKRDIHYIESAKALLEKYSLVFISFPIRKEHPNLEPRLECIHNSTELKCDIYFTKWKKGQNSSIIGYYLSLDNKIKLVMIILKYWGAVHGLIDPSFSNYSLTLLLIFYLQQSPYLLPPIASLDLVENSMKINGFWVRKCVSPEHFECEALANQSITEILHGFFNYYTNFDYHLDIICPYLGKPIPKKGFFEHPRNYNKQKNYKSMIFLQDPFSHKHKTKSLTDKFLMRFIELCSMGADFSNNVPVDPLNLHKLFTEIKPCIPTTEYYSSSTNCCCEFQINMDCHLPYISSEINKISNLLEPEEKSMEARKIWFNLVNKFIVAVLNHIMNCTVNIEDNCLDIKSQRLNGQTDVHDTDVIDAVTYHCSCSGSFNTKDVKLEKTFLNDLDLSDQSKLFKDICKQRFILHNLAFYINLQAKPLPTRTIVLLTNFNPKAKHFMEFGMMFAEYIPKWFKMYITELDKKYNVQLVEPKHCNCVNCKTKEFADSDSEEEEFKKPLCNSNILPDDSETIKCTQVQPEPTEVINNKTSSKTVVPIKFEPLQNDVTKIDFQISNIPFPKNDEMGPSTSHQRDEWDNCGDDISQEPLKQTPNTQHGKGSFTCNLCNKIMQANDKWIHLEGKKHRENMSTQKEHHENSKSNKEHRRKGWRQEQHLRDLLVNAKRKLINSILIKDLPLCLAHDTILKYASMYGNVIQSFFREDNQYAVLQFDELLSAQKMLKHEFEFNGIEMEMVSTNYSDTVGPRSLNFNSINKDLEMLPSDFQAQFNHLVEKVQPKWLVDNYRLLCSDLENILQEIFPGCTVFPFGTVGTGLGFTTSVVDVHVRFPKGGSTSITDGKQDKHYIESAKALLEKYSLVFISFPISKEEPNLQSKVECLHNPTELKCDIYFTKWKKVRSSSIIGYYLSLDNKVKSVMIIIKYWATVHGFIDSCFSNYSLTLLLIFYLQQSPYLLPPIASLHLEDSMKINGIWVRKCVSSEHLETEAIANQSIPQILCGFFNYYAIFDYALNVICPYLGKPIPKTDFFKHDSLRQHSRNYQIQRDHISIIFLQDPFSHKNNLTRLLTDKFRKRFIERCSNGADIAEYVPIYTLSFCKLFNKTKQEKRKKYSTSGSCEFQIRMGNHLQYISSKINKITNVLEPEEECIQARKIWYDLINKFIFSILNRVMKFTLSIQDNIHSINSKQLIGHTDVHDLADAVTYHCSRSGFFNSKESKRDKKFLRSIKLDNTSNLLKCICKKNFPLGDLEFHINLQAKVNPTRMTILLLAINHEDEYFKDFSRYLSIQIPVWFGKYMIELDTKYKVQLVQPEPCNCVNCKRKECEDSDSDEEEFNKPTPSECNAFVDDTNAIKCTQVQSEREHKVINNEAECKIGEDRLVPIKLEPLQDDVTTQNFQIKSEPNTEVEVKPLKFEPADDQTFDNFKSENAQSDATEKNVHIKTEPTEGPGNIRRIKPDPVELLEKTS